MLEEFNTTCTNRLFNYLKKSLKTLFSLLLELCLIILSHFVKYRDQIIFQFQF